MNEAPPRECDVAVVGGGILGLAVARELLARRPSATLSLFEAGPRLGMHQTGHSSGVVHAGIYYRPGSLKARLRDIAETVAWPGTWKLARRHWRAALREARHALSRRAFLAEAARLVPGLRGARALPAPAGIRAQALGRDGSLVDDFVVHRTERAIHIRNAPSPAATSSLPLARLVADELDALA